MRLYYRHAWGICWSSQRGEWEIGYLWYLCFSKYSDTSIFLREHGKSPSSIQNKVSFWRTTRTGYIKTLAGSCKLEYYVIRHCKFAVEIVLLSYSYAVSSKIEPFYKGGKVQVRLLYTFFATTDFATLWSARDLFIPGSQAAIQRSVKYY